MKEEKNIKKELQKKELQEKISKQGQIVRLSALSIGFSVFHFSFLL